MDDFQPVRPESCLDIFHREGGFDEWGEWIPSTTWKSDQVIQESTDWSLQVVRTISVWGHRSSRRCWPRCWYVAVRIGQQSQKVASGRCRSLRDAARQTKDLDVAPHVKELLRSFYGQERATPVYRQGGGSALDRVAHDGWVPWASTFGSAWQNASQWPNGKYLALDHDHASYIDVSYLSRSGGGDEESRRLFKILPRWCGP